MLHRWLCLLNRGLLGADDAILATDLCATTEPQFAEEFTQYNSALTTSSAAIVKAMRHVGTAPKL